MRTTRCNTPHAMDSGTRNRFAPITPRRLGIIQGGFFLPGGPVYPQDSRELSLKLTSVSYISAKMAYIFYYNIYFLDLSSARLKTEKPPFLGGGVYMVKFSYFLDLRSS